MGLVALADSFAASRAALHRVAEELVAPARKPDNEIALTQTPGGFGTPAFEHEGEETQVRVEGVELVLIRAGSARRARLDSLADAGALLGPGLLTDGVPDDRSPLAIEDGDAVALAEFFAFAVEILAALRVEAPIGDDPSEINLWPEHFDLAFVAGAEELGARANYGASPGDEPHPQPYLYVGPFTAPPAGELWNAAGFPGAELGYDELVEAADPKAVALEFFRSRRAELTR